MTPQEKAQEVAKLYQAFAEGKTLQLQDESQNKKWFDWVPSGDIDVPTIYITFVKRWRVKPEAKKIWYRVALFKYINISGHFLHTIYNEERELECQAQHNFIEWKTDRVYVEVESE